MKPSLMLYALESAVTMVKVSTRIYKSFEGYIVRHYEIYSTSIAEPDVSGSKSLLILEQHSNQPIRFEFTVVKFRLTIRVWCFYISVIHLSFASDFRDNL